MSKIPADTRVGLENNYCRDNHLVHISASIKSIIFDLGGVIINIDYSLTQKALEKFGVKESGKVYLQSVQEKVFDAFETGKISPREFRKNLKKIIPQQISDDELDHAWNAMLLDLPLRRIKLLEKLKTKYRLFLLSNTNEIHFSVLSEYLLKTYGFRSMKHIFEKEYLSYKLGMKKPERKIFELVLNENNLEAKETLFIDDTAKYIEVAEKIGFEVLLLKKGMDICSLRFGDE